MRSVQEGESLEYEVIQMERNSIVYLSDTVSIIECDEGSDIKAIVNSIEKNVKSSALSDNPEVVTLELDFCITRKCNLNCTYCYANQKSESEAEELSQKVAKDAIDFFYEKYPNVKWKVDFIGQGEPLLRLDLVLYIVEYIESELGKMDCTYFLISNGTLLSHEVYDELVKHDISVGVSIDGSEQIHNMNRPFRNGKGSYSIIKKNLESISGNNHNLWALSVINGNNDILSTVESIQTLGFKRIQLKVARIAGDKNSDREGLYRGLVEQYRKYFNKLTNDLLNNDMQLALAILNETDHVGKVLNVLLLKQKSFRRCKAGYARFTIMTNGDIYPCSSFGSIKVNKEGNVLTKTIDYSMIDAFKSSHVDNDPRCQKCWCRYLCGGKCKYSAHMESVNDKIDYDCESMKVLCQESIKLIYALAKNNPSILNKLTRFAELKQDV